MSRKPNGPKPADEKFALPANAPLDLELNNDERKAYRSLVKLLQPQGTATIADVQAVAMTARVVCHIRRLEIEVSLLPMLTIETKHGPKVHPLVVELRSTRAQLSQLYAQLLLNPRSRSASRVSVGERKTIAIPGDDLEKYLDE